MIFSESNEPMLISSRSSVRISRPCNGLGVAPTFITYGMNPVPAPSCTRVQPRVVVSKVTEELKALGGPPMAVR